MRRRPARQPYYSRCDAPDCNEPIERGKLMCRKHWFALPRDLRAAISSSWTNRHVDGRHAWSSNVLEARRYLKENTPAALAARITGEQE